ncbi:MAG: YkuS family protein [Caldicoprobacterales bacterium]|jgi:L-rhamnose isomerase|nr:hypothetical protein [Clostridiales bacterium]
MKTIALERGLEELKQALEEHGYNTVFADEIDTPVSVYIYQGQNSPGQAGLYSSLDNYMQSESESAGILLIQAKDKTPEQIMAMIENKVYSPLFYY